MKLFVTFLAASSAILGALPGRAQSVPASNSSATSTTASIYAQQQIDLLDGFSTTTDGFEARIKRSDAAGGRWSVPRRWTDYRRKYDPNNVNSDATITGMIGIHTHVLPNGKVLSWEGHNDDTFSNQIPHTSHSHAYEWNPNPYAQNGSYTYPNVYIDYENSDSNIFCSGHSFLANGKLLIAGGHYSGGKVERGDPLDPSLPINQNNGNSDYIPPGTGNVYGYIGLRDVNIFNYASNSITNRWQTQANSTLPAMTYRRWYPTNTTLGDGRVLVVAGQRYGSTAANLAPIQATIPEVYNPISNNWQQLSGAPRELPLYPFMFLAPDGQVFNAGPNADTRFLNPNAYAIGSTAANSWGSATYPSGSNLWRGYGSAAMYAPGKILLVGGAPTDASTTTSAEIIDINTSGVATFQPAASMQYGRTHTNATILADGKVLMTGGCSLNHQDEGDAVLVPELWTPPTAGTTGGGTWAPMNEMTVPRLYHSTAVLLPDATVLTTGGGQGASFPDRPDYQIFTPPYLCGGYARPQITSAPEAVAYGANFTVSCPTASDIRRYGRATLVRLPSVTHSFDLNQRFLELAMPSNSGTQLTLTAPANPNTCPPGHYMLFLISADGTPSHASIVAINPSGCTNTLAVSQSLVSETACERVTRFTVSGGTASSYIWTVNGSSSAGSTLDVTTSITNPTAQVTVRPSGTGTDCGASSTLISYFPLCPTSCPTCP